jgi:hypothetical protein
LRLLGYYAREEFDIDVSGIPIGPIFKGQDMLDTLVLTLEN